MANQVTAGAAGTTTKTIQEQLGYNSAALELLEEIEHWVRNGNTHNGKNHRFTASFKVGRHAPIIAAYVEQEYICHVTVSDEGLFIIAAD